MRPEGPVDGKDHGEEKQKTGSLKLHAAPCETDETLNPEWITLVANRYKRSPLAPFVSLL